MAKKLNSPDWFSETDPLVLAEGARAKAQALMSEAMRKSLVSRKELAVGLKLTPPNVDQMLSSDSDITVRRCAEWLARCGYRLEMTLRKLP